MPDDEEKDKEEGGVTDDALGEVLDEVTEEETDTLHEEEDTYRERDWA
jgi:hypothetical protein